MFFGDFIATFFIRRFKFVLLRHVDLCSHQFLLTDVIVVELP